VPEEHGMMRDRFRHGRRDRQQRDRHQRDDKTGLATPRSNSSALQAARNRAAAILSTCKLCADTKLENEVRRLQMTVGVRWLGKLDRWRGKQARSLGPPGSQVDKVGILNAERGVFLPQCAHDHAFRHGRFTAEAIAERRAIAALLRDMKDLVEQVDEDQ